MRLALALAIAIESSAGLLGQVTPSRPDPPTATSPAQTTPAQEAFEKALAERKKLCDLKGYGPEQTNLELRKCASQMHCGRVALLTAEGKVDEAREYLDRAPKNELVPGAELNSVTLRLWHATIPLDGLRLAKRLVTEVGGDWNTDVRLLACRKAMFSMPKGTVPAEVFEHATLTLEKQDAFVRSQDAAIELEKARADVTRGKASDAVALLRTEVLQLKTQSYFAAMESADLKLQLAEMRRDLFEVQMAGR